MATNIDGRLHVPRRRNVMRSFVLNEISAVDHPAQESAKAVILKRAEEGPTARDRELHKIWEEEVVKRKFSAEERQALADEGKALPDGSYPITKTHDLNNAIQTFGRGGSGGDGTPRIKAHIIRCAKALGLTDSLPEDWKASKADNGEGEMDAKELEKKVADLTAELAKAKEDGNTSIATLKAINAQLVEDHAFDMALIKAGLPPWLKDMKDGEGDGEDQKKSKAKKRHDFLALNDDARDKLITEKRADDEVVTIDGDEIRKSVVGASQFALFKKQAARLEKLEKANVEEVEKREAAELSKRADDTYPKLPGTTDEKVGVLRAIGKASKEVQATFEKMMLAGEKAIAAAFNKVGHGGGKPVATGSFLKRVDEVAARDKSSRTAAMEKARLEFPDEFDAYQNAN